MINKGFVKRLQRAGFYIPFTPYFILFVAAISLGYYWLQQNRFEPDTAFSDIFYLLLSVAGVFGSLILVLAFLSVVIPFAIFAAHRRKKAVVLQLMAAENNNGHNHQQTINLHLHPVFTPLLGFIKMRLYYDEGAFSPKFLLATKGSAPKSRTIEGTYHWPLPQIKEYHIETALIYFEDVFQFFSFTVDVPAKSSFFTQPTGELPNQQMALPRTTEDTHTRIEEMRRLEGEYLNYKRFENNDDVRRIVWKIYAKNGELVVRVPEVMDPYASHVYLYASFYTGFDTGIDGPVAIPFLNYYKEHIWSVYQSLIKQGWEVRYIPDQGLSAGRPLADQPAVKYSISTAGWQTTHDLASYVKTGNASLLVVSSLSDPDQIQTMLQQYSSSFRIVFIRLSDSLKSQGLAHLVQWMFIQTDRNDLEKFRKIWTLSPTLRFKITQNERKLQHIISGYQDAGVAGRM